MALAEGHEVQRHAPVRLLLKTKHETVRRGRCPRLAQRYIEFHAAGEAGSVRCVLGSTTPPCQRCMASFDFPPSTLGLEASR